MTGGPDRTNFDTRNIPPDMLRWLEANYGTSYHSYSFQPRAIDGFANMVNTDRLSFINADGTPNTANMDEVRSKMVPILQNVTPGAVYTLDGADGKVDVGIGLERGALETNESGRTTLQVVIENDDGSVRVMDYRPGMSIEADEHTKNIGLIACDDDTWDNGDLIGDGGEISVNVTAQIPTDRAVIEAQAPVDTAVDAATDRIDYSAVRDPERYSSVIEGEVVNAIETTAGSTYTLSADGAITLPPPNGACVLPQATISGTDDTHLQVAILAPDGSLHSLQNFNPNADGQMEIRSPGEGYTIGFVVAAPEGTTGRFDTTIREERIGATRPAPAVCFDAEDFFVQGSGFDSRLCDSASIPMPSSSVAPDFWRSLQMPAFDDAWMNDFMRMCQTQGMSNGYDPAFAQSQAFLNGSNSWTQSGMDPAAFCGGMPSVNGDWMQAYGRLLAFAMLVAAYAQMQAGFQIPTEIMSAPATRTVRR